MNAFLFPRATACIILASTLFISIAALPANARRLDDPAEIARRVRTMYSGESTGDIQFEQSGSGGTLKGHLVYSGRERYRLELPSQTIVSNGTRAWNYLPSRNQVVISNAAGSDRLTPGQLLTAFPGDYATSLAGSATVNGRAVWTMVCTPTSKRIGDVTRAVLSIDKQTYRIQQAVLTSPSFGTVTVRVLSAKYGASLPDSRFNFSAPSGARVIDMSR